MLSIVNARIKNHTFWQEKQRGGLYRFLQPRARAALRGKKEAGIFI